jgi:Spy/CpxP family protein refolding chaperone
MKLVLSLIACGAALVLCPGLQAQDAATPAPGTTGTSGTEGGHQWSHHGGGPMNAEMMIQRLTKELDLTADQQTQIKPIVETFVTTAQGIHQDTTLTPQDRKSKITDARETEVNGIKAVLTPDQLTKFAALMEHRGHRGQAAGTPTATATPTPTP